MSNAPVIERWATRLRQAMVPLLAKVVSPEHGQQWWITSGFVVETSDRWFWVTADHSFFGERYRADGLDVLRKHFDVVETSFFPMLDPRHAGIPVRINYGAILSIPVIAKRLAEEPGMAESERVKHLSELDISLLELTPFYRDQLIVCGTVPLTGKDLYREADPEFIQMVVDAEERGQLHFAIAGAPHSGLEIDGFGNLKSVDIKVLQIWPKSLNCPSLAFRPLWEEDQHSGSVQGMSGGPAIAIINGDLYWFGVQSSEFLINKPDATLKVAHAPFMFRVMEDFVAKLLQHLALVDPSTCQN